MYYRLIIENGHMGAGKVVETVRYFRAENPVELFFFAARLPRAKRKLSGSAVKLIEKVSREEYEKGLKKSARNTYMNTRRSRRKNRRPKGSVLFH